MAVILLVTRGGMIVLEGNGARPSHQGDGYAESETMYTLNTIERHSVCYSVDEKMGQTYIHEDKANTLAARDYKQPQAVCYWDGGQVAGTLTAQNSGGGTAQTIIARGPGAVCYKIPSEPCVREIIRESVISISTKGK